MFVCPSWSIINASDARPPRSLHAQPVPHPSLHTFSPPSVLLFRHHLISSFSPLSSPALSGLSVEGTVRTAAQEAAHYCRICCVRLAWFVLLVLLLLGASGFSVRHDIELSCFLKYLTVVLRNFVKLHAMMQALTSCWLHWCSCNRFPPLSEGHLDFTNRATWNVS